LPLLAESLDLLPALRHPLSFALVERLESHRVVFTVDDLI
jgi:hypothetical protein